jgi:serine/threonine protein kinase
MENCLCINPKCPQPNRQGDEQPCQACGADLLLNNRYRVISILHKTEGSITTVYDAIDTKDKSRKVLKVLYSKNNDVISRFDREADVLINHPIEVLPKVEPDGYFCIEFPNNDSPAYCLVMERIEGQNLEQWLENNSRIDEEQALDWLKQVTTILDKLHATGFFHRDIKPANIMRRESDGKLFLIDLGSVKLVSDRVLAGKPATIVGTYGYMSPEQQDGKPVPQSDFYALGRTFVHLLTKTHPSNLKIDKTDDSLFWRNKALPVSDQFDKFIDSLINKDVTKRPANTLIILQEIDKLQKRLQKQFEMQDILISKMIVFIMAIFVMTGTLFFSLRNQNLNNNNPSSFPTPTPTFSPSPSNNPACKIRKNGEKDINALAKDILDGINEAKQEGSIFDQIQKFGNSIYLPSQNDCEITIRIEDDLIEQELEAELKTVIFDSINPDAKNYIQIDIVPNYD